MGKSIRSKIKKQFRTVKRKLVEPHLVEQLKIAQEDLPVGVRPPETPESLARRNDPRKKDRRMGCQAFTLAFPGGVTGDEKRRGGIGNTLSITPDELSTMREIERAAKRKQREEDEAAEMERLREKRASKMEIEGPKKTIKKKGRSKSETSWGRING
mmetsp:Transcript_35905/g.73787  ORF Transcript_35905/g.73787 Transcript_35905/m.73787 type:complete len:157 (-) Transcript_35905:525-995(-)